MKTKVWNGLLNAYCEYEIIDGAYFLNGERVYRIETCGKSGTKLYTRYTYIDKNGYNFPCFGLSGSSGHGWGGTIQGFLTQNQISDLDIKIVRALY